MVKNGNAVPSITFIAEVVKVQTMADGSVRVVFGLSENSIPQMAMLAECQKDGIPLRVECKASA